MKSNKARSPFMAFLLSVLVAVVSSPVSFGFVIQPVSPAAVSCWTLSSSLNAMMRRRSNSKNDILYGSTRSSSSTWKRPRCRPTSVSVAAAAGSGVNSLESKVGYVKPDEVVFPEDMTDEWELDVYSRPVMDKEGKKLWEILLTDSEGSFRYVKAIPSNLVNSRNVRAAVEEVMEQSPVRPKLIRFFRNQMFNMITIALSTLDVEVKPSRRTYNLFSWLGEREANIYPEMSGYNPQLKQQTILDYDVTQPDRLPDVLRAESYAFVALPAEAFWSGEVNKDNVNRGRLCPIRDLPKTGWVHGITLFSKRSESVAAWMSGLEVASVRADLLSRELVLNTDITTQFIIAPLLEAQKKEAQIFEKGKAAANGYHFLSVQATPESEEVEGFWLIRQFDDDL